MVIYFTYFPISTSLVHPSSFLDNVTKILVPPFALFQTFWKGFDKIFQPERMLEEILEVNINYCTQIKT